nr:branchpoint-bridging protein [Quercus suber]
MEGCIPHHHVQFFSHVIWILTTGRKLSKVGNLQQPRLTRPPEHVRNTDFEPAPNVMSYRGGRPPNLGQTGANVIPLGTRRRGFEESAPPPDFGDARSAPSFNDNNKRGRGDEDEARGRDTQRPPREPEYNPDGTKKRRKRNRWGDASDNKAAGLMNLPTAITAPMTAEQLDAYVTHLRIEEISQKLRINDVVPADGDRSPSPAPQYNNFGHRVNTREFRYRKKLEDERHKLIEKAMKIIPSYHPPSDYRRPTKTQEKVYVPVNDYPEINFIGLLIGPRGNTLKKMETESQAKIAIRGKGSVKEGKGKSDAAHASNQDEDLHCLIMADTEEKIAKAKKLIHNVIETVCASTSPFDMHDTNCSQAASIPEGQNELKRNQLRELAALNGTLRDDENQACQNCGEIGHRKYDCPQARNFTASVICRVCGNAGHMARDCPDRAAGARFPGGPPRRPGGDAIDQDYDRLMNEIGGGGAPAAQIEYHGSNGDDHGTGAGGPPPWAGRGGAPPGGPAPWNQQSSGGEAPWKRPQNNGPAPWQQDRGGQDQNSGGYGGGYSNGNGYQQGPPGGSAPWQQSRSGGGGGAPWQQQNSDSQGYGAPPMAPWQMGRQQMDVPPPPPGDLPPPPPPSDIPPPPPPA